MYESCSNDLSVIILSISCIALLMLAAICFSIADRAQSKNKALKMTARRLGEDLAVLRQQKGALEAECRGYRSRAEPDVL